MAEQLENDIKRMQRQLAGMRVGRGRGSKSNGVTRGARGARGARGRGNLSRPVNALANMAQPPIRPIRGRMARDLDTVQGGIRISRCEYLMDVKGSASGDTTNVVPLAPVSFSWLSTLAKSFDRITWHAATLHYRPAVGTTKDGIVVIGPDWDTEGSTTKDYVMSATPIVQGPVWQGLNLVLPSARLMTRKEYMTSKPTGVNTDFDVAPCDVMWFCSGVDAHVYGQIWVTYDVTFFGTRKS